MLAAIRNQATTTPDSASLHDWTIDRFVLATAREALGPDRHHWATLEHVAMGVEAVMVTHPDSRWELELSTLTIPGYTWRNPHGDLQPMASYLVNGEPLALDQHPLVHDDAFDVIRTAVRWLAAQYIAHPDRHDDTGRPASVAEPIGH